MLFPGQQRDGAKTAAKSPQTAYLRNLLTFFFCRGRLPCSEQYQRAIPASRHRLSRMCTLQHQAASGVYIICNCSTKTEFIEKAIRFYCGYLLQNKPELIDCLAPQIGTITDGIVKGSEQRLSRAIFKLAVEVGVQTHLLAALNELDDTALFKLRSEVTDEVRRINGIINFENAVREQRS